MYAFKGVKSMININIVNRNKILSHLFANKNMNNCWYLRAKG